MAITKKQALALRKGDFVKVRFYHKDRWPIWVFAGFVETVTAYGIKSKRKSILIRVIHYVDLYKILDDEPCEQFDYPTWFNLKDVKLWHKKGA